MSTFKSILSAATAGSGDEDLQGLPYSFAGGYVQEPEPQPQPELVGGSGGGGSGLPDQELAEISGLSSQMIRDDFFANFGEDAAGLPESAEPARDRTKGIPSVRGGGWGMAGGFLATGPIRTGDLGSRQEASAAASASLDQMQEFDRQRPLRHEDLSRDGKVVATFNPKTNSRLTTDENGLMSLTNKEGRLVATGGPSDNWKPKELQKDFMERRAEKARLLAEETQRAEILGISVEDMRSGERTYANNQGLKIRKRYDSLVSNAMGLAGSGGADEPEQKGPSYGDVRATLQQAAGKSGYLFSGDKAGKKAASTIIDSLGQFGIVDMSESGSSQLNSIYQNLASGSPQERREARNDLENLMKAESVWKLARDSEEGRITLDTKQQKAVNDLKAEQHRAVRMQIEQGEASPKVVAKYLATSDRAAQLEALTPRARIEALRAERLSIQTGVNIVGTQIKESRKYIEELEDAAGREEMGNPELVIYNEAKKALKEQLARLETLGKQYTLVNSGKKPGNLSSGSLEATIKNAEKGEVDTASSFARINELSKKRTWTKGEEAELQGIVSSLYSISQAGGGSQSKKDFESFLNEGVRASRPEPEDSASTDKPEGANLDKETAAGTAQSASEESNSSLSPINQEKRELEGKIQEINERGATDQSGNLHIVNEDDKKQIALLEQQHRDLEQEQRQLDNNRQSSFNFYDKKVKQLEGNNNLSARQKNQLAAAIKGRDKYAPDAVSTNPRARANANSSNPLSDSGLSYPLPPPSWVGTRSQSDTNAAWSNKRTNDRIRKLQEKEGELSKRDQRRLRELLEKQKKANPKKSK